MAVIHSCYSVTPSFSRVKADSRGTLRLDRCSATQPLRMLSAWSHQLTSGITMAETSRAQLTACSETLFASKTLRLALDSD